MIYKKAIFFVTVIIFWSPCVVHAQATVTAGSTGQATQDKTRVAGQLNSDQFTEFAPSISADGKTMIIESNRNGSWQLFESKITEEGIWSEPKPIIKVNSFGDSTDLIGGPSISYDGNILFFFASFKGGFGSEDIYFSLREGDEWGTPINIGAPINTAGYEGFPSVSSDGKTLYFTRIKENPEDDKTFTESCFTIYHSKKGENGKWMVPEPLPYPVNNICDKAPRIMADNRTLIFSTYRPGVIGSYDLYQTQVDDDNQWSDPVPLTFVNTPQSDMFACISASGELMYFNTSNDIWSVIIPANLRQFKNVVMQGFVLDQDTKKGIGARIRVSDATTSEEIFAIENNPTDGRYSVVMAAGKIYNVEFIREGYSSVIYNYNLTSLDAYDMINQDVFLFNSVRLRLNIYDKELYEALPGTTRVVSESSGSIMAEKVNDVAIGYMVLNLPIGSKYTVNIELENFSPESFFFDISGLVLYRDFEKDIELLQKKMSVPINVTDISSNSKVKGKVVIRNKTRDEVIEVNANEVISLRVGDRYEIEATSDKGYFFASTSVTVTEAGLQAEGAASESIDIESGVMEMKLVPIDVNTSLNLNDILFESNSAQLSSVSFEELSRVIEVMINNPTMRVEISAHTDDVGSDEYNQSLSDKRANSVVDYLSSHDIPAGRFVAKGYGEKKPLVPNDSEENKSKNRRVELKVLEILN